MTVVCGTANVSTARGTGGNVRHKSSGSVHLRPLTSPLVSPEARVTSQGLLSMAPEDIVKGIVIRPQMISC